MVDPIFGTDREMTPIVPGPNIGSTPDIKGTVPVSSGRDSYDVRAPDRDTGSDQAREPSYELNVEDDDATIWSRVGNAVVDNAYRLDDNITGLLSKMSSFVEQPLKGVGVELLDQGDIKVGGEALPTPSFLLRGQNRAYKQAREQLGYKPKYTAKEIHQDPSKIFLDENGDVSPFLAETIANSSIDTAMALLTFPFYVATHTHSMAEERNQNNGGDGDYGFLEYMQQVVPGYMSVSIDRFGARYSLGMVKSEAKNWFAKVLQSITVEAGGEWIEEQIEALSTRLGTKKGYDPIEAGMESNVAALAGAAQGGGTRVASSITTGAMDTIFKASKAKAKAMQMKHLADSLRAMPTSSTTESAKDNFIQQMKDTGATSVWVDQEALKPWLAKHGDSVLEAELDVDLNNAELSLGMVEISADNFVNTLMSDEAFDEIADDILFEVDGVTARDADTFYDEGLQDAFKLEEVNDEGDADIADAERELGLDAMVQTAKDAGMTQKEWADYQAAREKHRVETKDKLAKEKAERDLRRSSNKIKKLKEKYAEEAKEEVAQRREWITRTAVLDNGGLDRGAVDELMESLGSDKKNLPKMGTRVLYSKPGVSGVDPDLFAHYNGYVNATEMVLDWIQHPSMVEDQNEVANQKIKDSHPDLFAERETMQTVRSSVMNTSTPNMLEAELALLEKMTGKKQKKGEPNKFQRLSQMADEAITEMQVGFISSRRFVAQAAYFGKKAGTDWRARRYTDALKNKYRQILNTHMAMKAEKVNAEITKGVALVNKFIGKKDRFVSGIVDMPTTEVLKAEWIDSPKGDPAPYKQWSVKEFRRNVNTIKELQHKIREAEKTQKTIDDYKAKQAGTVVRFALQDGKTAPLNPEEKRHSFMFKFNTGLKEVTSGLLHPDTIIQMIDGDWGGMFRDMVKKPYDKAMSGGYNGNVGYVQRWADTMKQLGTLYDKLPNKTRNRWLKNRDVPGVDKLTNEQFMAILLNMGNEENFGAVIDNRGYTADQLQAILETASDEELSYVQGVWDLFDSFHNEIVESQKRRRNVQVGKVEGHKFTVRGKTYRGGYYPLAYVHDTNPLSHQPLDVETHMQQLLYGSEATYHTADGHTKSRADARALGELRLDLNVANEKLHALVYDLEVGDAMVDIYRVLYSNDVKSAFKDHNRQWMWDQLDIFFKDAVTDEKAPVSAPDKIARNIRVGGSYTKLGYNVGVGALQALGIFNAAPLLGTMNIISEYSKGVSNGFYFNNKFANASSGLMLNRSDTFNREINENYSKFNLKKNKKVWDYLGYGAYFLMKTFQRTADVSIYKVAYKQAVKSGKSHVEAVDQAERMVVRTQGSGIFGDRSAWERGSTRGSRQNQWVRIMTFLMSYHIATNNVITTKGINESGMRKALKQTLALAIATLPEALIFGALKGDLPDDDDPDVIAGWATSKMASKYGSGIVGINLAVSALNGYQGRGAYESILNTPALLVKELQKEDPSYLKVFLMGGEMISTTTPFRIPFMSPIKKWHQAYTADEEGKDVKPWHYLLGPPVDEDD